MVQNSEQNLFREGINAIFGENAGYFACADRDGRDDGEAWLCGEAGVLPAQAQ
ncbi:hypothetical protein D3C86_2130470 [compost metagenome]